MRYRSMASLLLALAVPGLAWAKPMLAHSDVFVSGKEGYHTFRIPSLATAADGSLIAVAEGRKYNAADPGFENNDIDLVGKRSSDGGKTWSKLQVIDDPGERWSACNPTMVVDRVTGRVWLCYCRTRPGRSSATSRPGTDDAQAWVRSSKDGGASWSRPTDITKVARDVDNWAGGFFGPGSGIQDKKGRLIVPMSKTTRGNAWDAYVIYSDDHGHSWQRGQLLPDGDRGNENQLVELADGRILMDVRQNKGPHRWLAISRDRGQSWSNPQPGQTVTPVCCAIRRYALKSAGADRNRILWSGPKDPTSRANLVVRVSYDEGQSFTNERLISALDERAAYSDLTILQDKSVGVLWERGGYRFITFSRLNREFLESK